MPHLSRTQLRYSAMYILVTSVILVFLNLYAADTMRDLIFRGKHSFMQDKVLVASAAMGELPGLTVEQIGTVLEQVDALDLTRVLITDAGGTVIYDSLSKDSAVGQVALLPEVVQALEGNDTFCSVYSSGVLQSKASAPVLRGDRLVGCVYLMEYDSDQGSLIEALQKNILWISLLLEVAVIVVSLFFSEIFSHRMRKIFASIRIIREGDYSHKLKAKGSDELSVLAREFNALTERIQASEERRRQFVSDASHELKTPLTSIKLLSDSILQNEMDRETILEFVQDIGSEADRLTRMSQKLLSLTKVDAQRDDDREIVDIFETVEKVFRMLKPVAGPQNITLRNHALPGATVLTMEDDLYQIIFNLAENGIKYNKPNGSLTVELTRQDNDWVLTLTDTGVGIPQESIGHIFERFYRVDKARSRQAGGSGLGLSIVYAMVTRNGGSICVSQPDSGGTCFAVTFPAFDLEEDEDLWLEE